jgi:hypothetical protein
MSNDEKAELKKEVLAVTKLVVIPKSPKADPMSPKAKEIKKVMDKMPPDWLSDSKGKFLTELVESLVGEKLSINTHLTGLPHLKDDSLKKFMIIVPEENTNSSDYAPGKPVMAVKDGMDACMMANGKIGNHIEEQDCRFATAEEVDLFLDELQKRTDAQTVINSLVL